MRNLRLWITVCLTWMMMVLGMAAPANATGYDSYFVWLNTPSVTDTNLQVGISGRIQPAAAGRTVSLYKANPDGTATYVRGAVTDGAGNFGLPTTITEPTTFRIFSAKQIVGADTYRAVTSGDFSVRPAEVTYSSSFSALSTPEFTNSGNQQVVLTGRVQPAAAGRTISLYKVDPGGASAYVQGAVTDAAGNFAMTTTVSVITTFRLFSAKQVVGVNTYQATSSGDFVVKSLRLWDSFDYTSPSQMQPKWNLRTSHENYGSLNREHTKASWDAISFDGTGAAHFGIVPDGLAEDGQQRFKVAHISAGNLGIVNGHIEARIKFHRPKGAHGALWWNSGYGSGGGEFDVAEFFGERSAGSAGIQSQKIKHSLWPTQTTEYAGNTWTGLAGDSELAVYVDNFTGGVNNSWWNEWHVYEGYWANDRYVFSIDGKKIHVLDSSQVPVATVPGEVLLSLLVSQWAALAKENESFTLSKDSTGLVRYGQESRWVTKSVKGRNGVCSNAFFGVDPAPGVLKKCQVLGGEYQDLKDHGNTGDYRMSVDWIRVWR